MLSMRDYIKIVEGLRPQMNIPDVLYHVTPLNRWPTIQKVGIEPRTGSWGNRHKWVTPKIFFVTHLIAATEMAMMFEQERRHGTRDYIILKVDPHKIPKAKFQHDSQNPDGVWCRSPVPPEAIIGTEDVDPESEEFQRYMGAWEDEE